MPTNKEITENLPYTRKGICAECGKSIPLDSEGNSEYDFFQHRRYSTMNYKIDYHFCSQSCMQKKIGKQPLSNIQARAEGYEEGTYNDFIAFMHEYDLPDSQLTKGGQLFRDKLLAVRDRIYKKAQSDLFKELEDELNKKLNNQHFRTTDFKFIAGYREAIKEMLQALKSSKGIK